jgi:hypothetical protein
MLAGARRIRRPRWGKPASPLSPKHHIFNHIAKIGGTSLLAVCGRNLEPAEINPLLAEPAIRLVLGMRSQEFRSTVARNVTGQ